MSDELAINSPLPDEPAPVQAPPSDPQAEPEPEGVVEVAGQKMVPVGVLTAERRRIREAHEREMAPVRERLTRAQEIEQRLDAWHQQQREPARPPAADDPTAKVSDEKADRDTTSAILGHSRPDMASVYADKALERAARHIALHG